MANTTLKSGQLLKYIGKRWKNLNISNPFMKFLGYDGNGFADVWVEYQGRLMLLAIKEVELVSLTA
ncbi:hypothetical protein [Mucilaginibacter sp.]|jgi:hypothetical protein|uniref:hypothetical protein n=1 Tax=Mucilaginibacter sp. TaxID=1882438 RepID=UPI0025E88BA5|nr:hypothetical protein [Mucilaginibacter sp.]